MSHLTDLCYQEQLLLPKDLTQIRSFARHRKNQVLSNLIFFLTNSPAMIVFIPSALSFVMMKEQVALYNPKKMYPSY